MTTKVLNVCSSSGGAAYTVVIEWDGKDLSVACNCKAGLLGDWCRHKSGLLNGDEAILAVKDDLTDLRQWVRASPVHAAISRIRDAENQQSEAEASLKKAKTNVLAAKKAAANLINKNRNK